MYCNTVSCQAQNTLQDDMHLSDVKSARGLLKKVKELQALPAAGNLRFTAQE